MAVTSVAALAEHVIQWAYDLIVLDPSKGPFRKKVTGSLLDGILGLVESLMVFEAPATSDRLALPHLLTVSGRQKKFTKRELNF